MVTESGPAFSLQVTTRRIPLAQVEMPLPFRLPSVSSPSYPFPVGQRTGILSQSQRSVAEKHTVRTPLPFWLQHVIFDVHLSGFWRLFN